MNESKIAAVVNAIYQSRKLKLTEPEGYIDEQGRWFPTPREDAGDGKSVSMPTAKSRYSFKIHCRSKHHVRILVGRALQGHDVPPDVLALVSGPGVRKEPEQHAKKQPEAAKTATQRALAETFLQEFFAFLEHRSANAKHGMA